jgi:hypothetical protein
LNTWRKELKGKARFEASSTLMVACRKFAQEYRYARAPLGYYTEWLGRGHPPDEPENERLNNDEWYARSKRAETLGLVTKEIQEAGWAAEVVLDQTVQGQIKDTVQQLLGSANQLNLAIDQYFNRQIIHLRTGQTDDAINVLMNIWWRNIYDQSQDNKPDQSQAAVEQTVETLGQALRQYLQ